MTRRIDTRYILTYAGTTYIGRWTRTGFSIIDDPRTPDTAMINALDKGWEGHYAGAGFGAKTTEAICARFGYEWEPHSVVAKYDIAE